MADKFKGFWIMEAGERDEQYLHPASTKEVATQLRAMGYVVAGPDTKWKVEKTPYLSEIMEELKEGEPIKTVTVIKGATPGPTTCINEAGRLARQVQDKRLRDAAKAGG